MKVLLAHTTYQQAGGEDTVFRSEVELLRTHGVTVVEFIKSNDALSDMSRKESIQTTLWNASLKEELKAVLHEEKPDVAHFHNTFPFMSPAAYVACQEMKVPVVKTLHNYRLLCPNALFFRDGHACEDCLTKSFKWPAIAHRCYRESRAASGVVALLLATKKDVYHTAINRFICLTEFAKRKHIEGGYPAEKLAVKQNFMVTDPGVGNGGGNYALFVGRLTSEKGADTLIDAWIKAQPDLKLVVIGDGPMLDDLKAQAVGHNIEFWGRKSRQEVLEALQRAEVVIIPSRVYEGLPMSLVEGYACGTPVIAPDHAALPDLIEDGGWLYPPNDSQALAKLIGELSLEDYRSKRSRARAIYEQYYTPEVNFKLLEQIYQDVIRSNTR